MDIWWDNTKIGTKRIEFGKKWPNWQHFIKPAENVHDPISGKSLNRSLSTHDLSHYVPVFEGRNSLKIDDYVIFGDECSKYLHGYIARVTLIDGRGVIAEPPPESGKLANFSLDVGDHHIIHKDFCNLMEWTDNPIIEKEPAITPLFSLIGKI